MTMQPSVVLVVADGVRPDTLREAVAAGDCPALADLAAAGGLHDVTSVFPSVTGMAYTPFLMGRSPAAVGLPGLRWYDRTRRLLPFPHHARSYVGHEVRYADRDLDPRVPTLFELAQPSLGAMTMVGRGLARDRWIGRGVSWTVRAARTHFRGVLDDWLRIDQEVAGIAAERVRRDCPRFALIALLGIDKMSHAEGHQGPRVREALRIVDGLVARLREDARRDGLEESRRIWVVSDHGHSRVLQHENLAGLLKSLDLRVLAHPWIYRLHAPDVAVMVSGNAMAHIYLELERRARPWWPRLAHRWQHVVDALLARESVDFLLLPESDRSCLVVGRGRGQARITWNGRFSYRPESGDPLGYGDLPELTALEAHEATARTRYPDGLLQVARACAAERSGDILVNAAEDWDLRHRYEPIPHRSTHGGLQRDHMMVPLLLDRPPARPPRRTADVMASVCHVLGITTPDGVEGVSFY